MLTTAANGRSQHLRSLRHDRGLTRIEVLVILGIFVLLGMLLLPSIQEAREAARRTTCKGNLFMLGFALRNYHETYNYFPMPCMTDVGNPPLSGTHNLNGHSWGTSLLPFMNEGPLHARIDFKTPSYSASGIGTLNTLLAERGRPPHNTAAAVANEAAISTLIATFNCPSAASAPRTQTHGYPELEGLLGILDPSAAGSTLTVTYASSDFQVLSGISDAFVKNLDSGPTQLSLVGIMSNENVNTRMNDVTDGLSNTWMISERAGANDVWRGKRRIHEAADGVFVEAQANGTQFNIQTGGGWGDFDGGEFWLSGSLKDGTSPDGHGPCFINCTNLSSRGLYSFHPGVILVLYGDGAVRTVSESIDTNVVVECITREGGSGTSEPPG